MKKRLLSILLVFTLFGSISGCATLEDNKGAAVGATLGATAGVLLGSSTSGRIAGGLIGALVGGAIGHYAYDKNRTSEETAKTYNYKPSQGSFLSIENAATSPSTIRSGDTVDIAITYAVLNQSSEVETTVTEIREITHKGELVGKPEVKVVRTAGTYTSTIPLRLPSHADPGVYKVKTTVQSPKAKDVRYTQFTVQ